MLRRCVWLGALLTVLGCGGGGGDTTISDQPLSGKIGGVAWTFATGETNAFLSMGDTFFVELYGAAFTACDFGAAPTGANTFIFEIPKAVGSYPLSLQRNATFYEAATSFNRVATRGLIVIDTLDTATAGTMKLAGGAKVVLDANNTIDGRFQATICSD